LTKLKELQIASEHKYIIPAPHTQHAMSNPPSVAVMVQVAIPAVATRRSSSSSSSSSNNEQKTTHQHQQQSTSRVFAHFASYANKYSFHTSTRVVAGRRPFSLSWLILTAGCCFWFYFLVSKHNDYSLSSSSQKTIIPSQQVFKNNTSMMTTTTTTTTTTKKEIRAIFDKWNEALSTGDPSAVARLYYYDDNDNDETYNHESNNNKTVDKKEDVSSSSSSSSSSSLIPLLLLPTMSNKPRTDRNSIETYFAFFLRKKPKGRIVNGHIRIGNDGSWAHDAGIYEFSIMDNNSSSNNSSENDTGGRTTTTTTATATTNNPNNNDSVTGNNTSNNNNNNVVVIQARYSFLYIRNDQGEWKIAHHHSSLMPE
jgi:hypothetical protein